MTEFRAHQLKKSYRQRMVVKGVDISVRSGEIIGLLGRNGAGKTTSFLMMVGLVKPDSGSIFLDSIDISRFSTPKRAAAGIVYLPQENSIFLKTTVENNLKMILEMQPMPRKRRKAVAHQLLSDLGLLSLAKQGAYSLSGGERRRLEICRALVLNPKFLLLDEPFTGIDPLTIVELQKIFLKLKASGIGIVISDHNVRDTLSITDKATIIDNGSILAQGTPKEIAANEAARENFLGKDFRLGQEIAGQSALAKS